MMTPSTDAGDTPNSRPNVARATVTIVVYDYAANKSAPIPDEWRTLVKGYEVVAPAE